MGIFRFNRTHVFGANFQVDVPNMDKHHDALSYITNDWHLTGGQSAEWRALLVV